MKLPFSLFYLVLGVPISLFSQETGKTSVNFVGNINSETARKHLTVLASDEYEGRETGKEGQKKAAFYIARTFREAGLEPVTDSSYFQKVPLIYDQEGETELEIGDKKLKNGKDFYLFPFTSELKITADSILFLGYGIADNTYNDYDSSNIPGGLSALNGRVLLLLSGEPLSDDSVSLVTGNRSLSSWSNSYRRKVLLARDKGAAAVIMISKDFEKNLEVIKNFGDSPSLKIRPDNDSGELSEKKADDPDHKENNGKEKKKIPQFGIPLKLADALLAHEHTSAEKLRKKIIETRKPVSMEVHVKIRAEITNRQIQVPSENVLCMIRGTEQPEEIVMVTAHYDHLGIRDGKVYNGADDDGSGTTGVLMIADAFSKARQAGFAPKRTMVFMTVTGEEKGLLGSSYYTSHPIFPLENTVCDLNIDMIGRTDDRYGDSANYIYIIGSDKISTELHAINEKANADHTLLKLDYKYNDTKDPNRFYYRSDHYNFARKGVPIIFYFNGVHDDYHEETDEVSKINFEALAKRAQLVFYTAWEVANRKDRIVSDVKPTDEKKGKN